MLNKTKLKKILGELPFTVEICWYLLSSRRPWTAHFNLDGLQKVLPEAVEQTKLFAQEAPIGKRIFLFASLHYWIEQTALLGLALVGQGHEVSFGYLPYAEWDKPITKFDIRKQNIYARQVLGVASDVMEIVPLVDVRPISRSVSMELKKIVEDVSVFDTQYTLQVEEVDRNNTLYQLRYERNMQAALSLRAWLMAHRPDVVVVPNGTIQEMGILYQVARMLNIDTVSFEFGDQRERIWLAQNSEIMRHDTDALWKGLGKEPITEEHRKMLVELVSARRSARLGGSMARKWQGVPTEGTLKLRKTLGLDDRPVVLLATNVLGDSLTLGRQVFSKTMAEWIKRTVKFFLDKEDIQLIIRVHPGEMFTQGASMVDVVRATVAEFPEHIHLIGPEEKINTYDIVEAADLGLVYTTTVGLEMAMAGIPVVIAGKTHYSERGFTHDPKNWKAYLALLSSMLEDLTKYRLSPEQVELAWRYAYLFFFEFPLPFPWHLLFLMDDIKERPIAYVLSEEGQRKYGDTFRYLVGEKLDWVVRG